MQVVQKQRGFCCLNRPDKLYLQHQQGTDLIRPAADMEGNEEFLGDILEDFWRIFEKFWKNLFIRR